MSNYDVSVFKFDHDIDELDALSDSLGRSQIAASIGEELYVDTRSRLIAIYGRWGAGKSHLLSQTINYLLERNKTDKTQIIVCTFKTWRYELVNDLAAGLIRSLMQVENQFKNRNPNMRGTDDIKRVGKFILELLSTIGSSLGTPGELAALLSTVINLGISNAQERQKDVDYMANYVAVDKVKEAMEQLVEAILNAAHHADNTKQYRLVVFIDDLDRCSPENMVRMFEWLKVNLMVNGCTYVMGLDNIAAARAIVGRYKGYLGNEQDLSYGFRYLEKLVDNHYDLQPSFKTEELAIKRIFEPKFTNLKDVLCGEHSHYKLEPFAELERVGDLLHLHCLCNPRTMLKIMYRYKRVMAIATKQSNDLTQLGYSYSFWSLFLIAMSYCLDPYEITEFVAARGNIYKLMNNHQSVDERNWSQDITSPMHEFCRFAYLFNKELVGVTLPRTDVLENLAKIVRENSLTL